MNLFSGAKALLAMIHVGALPGTPRATRPLSEVVAQTVDEARIFTDAGVDGLLIENMHDVPYLCGSVGPEIVAAMTAVGVAVRAASPLPLGVQILAAANREALAVAHACGAGFVRVENFAFAHVADEGLMPTADAGPLLRYRRQIGADAVRILTDVKKKHSSHAITADISLDEAASAAEFFGADGVIVTGSATGRPTSPEDVAAVRQAVKCSVCVGSGVTPQTLPALWPHADVFIVGSYLKQAGVWSNPVDPARVGHLVDAAAALRR
ncbi:putative sgc region protein SgcQ [Phycisphaerae bacterium RAS1]|nr:putative sgc region protein SgcQ [Phycisphaerae bacterium RAS1]